jgi:hypothetical protein
MSFLIKAAWSDISNSIIHQMRNLWKVGVLVKNVESLLKLEDFLYNIWKYTNLQNIPLMFVENYSIGKMACVVKDERKK